MTLANRILGFVNAPALMQRVVEQLQDVTVDTSIYAKRREIFCSILDDAGFDYVKPKGAFYLFPKSPVDDVEFCTILRRRRFWLYLAVDLERQGTCALHSALTKML